MKAVSFSKELRIVAKNAVEMRQRANISKRKKMSANFVKAIYALFISVPLEVFSYKF